MKDAIKLYIDEILEEIIQARRHIHSNPELSGFEFNTSEFIYDKLRSHNIDSEIMNDGVGVTTLIKGEQPGKTVAYRADIDALPMIEKTNLSFKSTNNNAHSCGHDIHTSVLLGTTLVLNKFRSKMKGNVRVIFQSGEEIGTGAKAAIDYGVIDDPDIKYIIALHTWPDLPAGTIGLKKGPMMASSATVDFKINGKGGHAAHPHKAVDPVTIVAYIITAIQSIVSRNIAPLESAVITFGKVEAGTASNIIPDYAIAQGTVRTQNPEVNSLIEKRIREIVEHQAKSFGATGEVIYKNAYMPVINDKHVIDILEKSSESSIGRENIHFLENPSMGGEDFAFYLEKVPGALIRLGTSNETKESELALHNSSLIFDEKSIEAGIKFMSKAILALLDTANRE